MTAVEHSKVMVLSLLIHFLLLPPSFCWYLCLVHVYCASLGVVLSVVIISLEKRELVALL